MDDGSDKDATSSSDELYKSTSKPSLPVSLRTRSQKMGEKIGNDEYQHSYASLKQLQVRQRVANSKAFQLMFPGFQITTLV